MGGSYEQIVVGMISIGIAGYACSEVLLTLGARGMQYFGRDGALRVTEPALAQEVFDVSGAGDTVAATFALAVAAGVIGAALPARRGARVDVLAALHHD